MPMPASIALATLVLAAAAAPWSVITARISETSEDGHVKLEVAVPVLSGNQLPAVRDTINRELWNLSDVARLVQEAREGRLRHEARLKGGAAAPDPVLDSPYHCQVEYRTGLVGPDLVSFCFQTSGYKGGMASGFEVWRGCTFNARTGQAVDLATLFGADWRVRLKPLLVKGLRPTAETLFEDWQQRLDRADLGFYLMPEALVVYFPRSEIAPGVRGVVTVEISLDQLTVAFLT